jgi:hypothetical protein
VKLFGCRVVPAVLVAMLMLVLYVSGAGRRDGFMKTIAFAAERPPIDLAVSAKLETATFALG